MVLLMADSTHELDGREETLERLEAAASECWGDKWTIRVTHFSDGTTQAYAFRSRGIVDDDRDEKTFEEERLYNDGEQTVFSASTSRPRTSLRFSRNASLAVSR